MGPTPSGPYGRHTPATLMHVNIRDSRTGELLADVDAHSTADGLAYFLDSRRIVEGATEWAVWRDAYEPPRNGKIGFRQTAPVGGETLRGIFAEAGA